jgi:hypothetical protein
LQSETLQSVILMFVVPPSGGMLRRHTIPPEGGTTNLAPTSIGSAIQFRAALFFEQIIFTLVGMQKQSFQKQFCKASVIGGRVVV